MGQYYKAVVMTKDTYGIAPNTVKVFTFPGSLKLTEHSWNGNSDLAEVMREVQRLTFMAGTEIRVAWVGDYSRHWYEPGDDKADIHEEAYALAWGEYAAVEPTRGHPAYGWMYAVNDDLREAVGILGVDRSGALEMLHSPWWMCAWPILNAVGNGEGGGDYHGPNEDLAGTWAYDRQRILHDVPKGYRLLPAHLFAEDGMSEHPAQEVSL